MVVHLGTVKVSRVSWMKVIWATPSRENAKVCLEDAVSWEDFQLSGLMSHPKKNPYDTASHHKSEYHKRCQRLLARRIVDAH